jgi:hypothetical protein
MEGWGRQLLFDVIVQEVLFKGVDRGTELPRKKRETIPDQEGTGDMVTLNTSQASLTLVNAGELLNFAV